MKVNLAYKFKLLPDHSQEKTFLQWSSTCRFLYNLGLEHRILHWSQYRKSPNYFDQANELKELKRVEGFEWLKAPPAQLLQQALKDLNRSFLSFWQSGFGFPKYRKKGVHESFRFPDPKQFFIEKLTKRKGAIKLPKLGKVHFLMSRKVVGEINNATIRKEGGSWYLCLNCTKERGEQKPSKSSVGIDRGISQTIALSDMSGFEIDELTLPSITYEIRERIKILQKRLRLKKKFSKKWQQLQRKIQKLHSKIARIRTDFLHKISTRLAKRHGHIVLEDLKIKNMSKSAKGTLENSGNHVKAKSGLNREILFQGWGLFAQLLSYKTDWRGGVLELVNPRNTSIRCSQCLYESKENRKGKNFCCKKCGHTEDADDNAAKNINRAGRAHRDCGDVETVPINEAITSSCALAH